MSSGFDTRATSHLCQNPDVIKYSSDQTHLYLNKTADVLQTVFISVEIIIVGFTFHLNLFFRVIFTACQHILLTYNGLALNWRQAITWTNDGPNPYDIIRQQWVSDNNHQKLPTAKPYNCLLSLVFVRINTYFLNKRNKDATKHNWCFFSFTTFFYEEKRIWLTNDVL